MQHDLYDDEEDDDDDYLDILLDDDADEDWDDSVMLPNILKNHPEFEHILRIRAFSATTLRDIDEWLSDNCREAYKRIGWSAGCSSSVGVLFSDITDALLFKLRWC